MIDPRLNDRGFVTRHDPKGMLGLFEAFPDQCREALKIGRTVEPPRMGARPGVVCLTGMGGSAAGGDLARALFEAQGICPFLVNRDYGLPKYVGLGDLVFCVSYSGNTEETLAAYEAARAAAAKIVVVASGGRLADLARKDRNPLALIPPGLPPRTSLGHLLMPVLAACESMKLLPAQDYEAAFALLDRCRDIWTVEAKGDNPAKTIGAALHGELGVLMGLGSWQGVVANRWKGQINEDAKNLALASTFPELNHNEILGWAQAERQGVAGYVAVVLRDGKEGEKMRTRERVTRELVGSKAEFHDAVALGESLLERMLSLTYLGDFVSIYLAALNGVDPENIDAINVLKTELGKVR